MAFSESDLQKMGLKQNPDGSYSKEKSKPQPREITPKEVIDVFNKTGNLIISPPEFESYRTIKLTLFGIPMAKQSVRGFDTGKRNSKGKAIIGHFQPSKMGERTKDYIKQIKEQLPLDFKCFNNEVFITKLHFIYPPLKAFHKVKGKMEDIRNGKMFYKNTKPDMPDNLKKLVLDAMSGIIYRDDCIIVGEDDVRKYYGMGGCIIIELKGW